MTGAVASLSLSQRMKDQAPFVKIVEDHFRDRLCAGDEPPLTLPVKTKLSTKSLSTLPSRRSPTDSLDDGEEILQPNEHYVPPAYLLLTRAAVGWARRPRPAMMVVAHVQSKAAGAKEPSPYSP